MINDFVVRGYPEENFLKVVLNGFFMKSEVELALHLAKSEAKKLTPDFDVFFDIKNLRVAHKNHNLGLDEMKRVLKLMGAGNIHISGPGNSFKYSGFANVGFYSYENEWFFS